MKWIKLATNLFEDEKILLIENMENSTGLILCWIKLLCLAGKQENGGEFLLGGSIPYTTQMLATVLRMEVEQVQRAVDVFQQLRMVQLVNGVLTIPNWNRHQSLNAYERKLNYDRDYRRKKAQTGQTQLCRPYGCNKNVMLTDRDYEALKAQFPADYLQRLDRLSEYMRTSGRSYDDPVEVIRKWAREDALRPVPSERSFLELVQEEG